jgi:hypothetical protein
MPGRACDEAEARLAELRSLGNRVKSAEYATVTEQESAFAAGFLTLMDMLGPRVSSLLSTREEAGVGNEPGSGAKRLSDRRHPVPLTAEEYERLMAHQRGESEAEEPPEPRQPWPDDDSEKM